MEKSGIGTAEHFIRRILHGALRAFHLESRFDLWT